MSLSPAGPRRRGTCASGSLPARHGLLVVLLPLVLTACESAPRERPPILLFTGVGTSPEDVAAVERILGQDHLRYALATSSRLNAMGAAELQGYRLLIVPGGNFIDMSASLAPNTMTRVHDAVQSGVNYLGICAGAFLAGDGRGHYRSLDLAAGVRFGFYADERRGIRKSVVSVAGVDGPPIEQYWEDGPELSGWGAVVAKYPDGTPAVTEGESGRGWVVLVGFHPEAPESWRRGMHFTTPASVANAYAGTILGAALNRSSLPHY